MVPTEKSNHPLPGGLRHLLWLIPLMVACSLKVDDLPLNTPPDVGEIVITPYTAPLNPGDTLTLAPTDSFTVRVEANDSEGDNLFFTWSANSIGAWLDEVVSDSVGVWIAPADFQGIDTVKFSVLVHDGDLTNSVSRNRDIKISNKSGPIRVLVVNTSGDSARVKMAVAGHDTTTYTTCDHRFEGIPWGDQTVFTFDSDEYYGAYVAEAEGGERQDDFDGYPRMIFNHHTEEDTLIITVAPKSVLLIPGKREETLIEEIQAGIDYCSATGIDTLMLIPGDYEMPGHFVDPENQEASFKAALLFRNADLCFMTLPDRAQPRSARLDAGGVDFGLYFEDCSPGMMIRDIQITGSTSSGACLSHSSARFDSVIFESCGAAGVFLSSLGGDTLSLSRTVILDNEYGISLSGGHLVTENTLIQGSTWYGLWARDGATANLDRTTLVLNKVQGAILRDTGDVTLERCLFSRNGFGIFADTEATVQLNCNLFWNNSFDDYRGIDPGPEDILEDPLFCDPDLFDWRLQSGSPAKDAACSGDQQIGAFGVCDQPTRRAGGGSP